MRSGFISRLCAWDRFCSFSSVFNVKAVRIALSNIHLTQGGQTHSPGSDITFLRRLELAQAEVEGLVGLPHPGQVWSLQARPEHLPYGGAEGCPAAAPALTECCAGMHRSGKAGQSRVPTEGQLRETSVSLEGASWGQGTCSAAAPACSPPPGAAAAAALTGPGGCWQPRRRGGHQLTAPGSASSGPPARSSTPAAAAAAPPCSSRGSRDSIRRRLSAAPQAPRPLRFALNPSRCCSSSSSLPPGKPLSRSTPCPGPLRSWDIPFWSSGALSLGRDFHSPLFRFF